MNLQSDLWRTWQLYRSTSNPQHPRSGFSTGDSSTLNDDPASKGVDIRDVLLNFYRQNYSANLMKLVILGSEDLEILQKWTVEKFSDIPNSNLPTPSHEYPLYTEKELTKLIKVKPVMDTRSLEISFAISDQESNWESQPDSYYSYLLAHRAPGSLFHYLKRKGWANELYIYMYTVATGSGLFQLKYDLTSEGLDNYEEIIYNFFQYVKLVVEKGPERYIWDEIEVISKLDFRFREKSIVFDTVQKLSGNLQNPYVPEEFVLSHHVLRKWVAKKVQELGTYFTTDNLRVMLCGRELDGLNLTEKWYGTKYSIQDFDEKFVERLKNAELHPSLSFPNLNEFIPENIEVRKAKFSKPLVHPYLIEDTDSSRIWFKKDDQFWVPKGSVDIFFHLPISNKTSTNSVLISLFTSLVEDELKEIVYCAGIAGLILTISNFRDGFRITVTGYNDKIPILLESVLERIVSFQPSADRFAIIKEKLAQKYKNFGYDVPYQQIGYHLLNILCHERYSNEQRLNSLKSVNSQMLENFLPLMWQEHFKEILIHGNFEISTANEIKQLINEKTKHIRVLRDKYVILPRSYVLPIGKTLRYEMLLADEKNINSCIYYFVKIGDDYKDKPKLMLTELLGKILREPAFDRLRTKEHLGYAVFSGLKRVGSTLGWRILVQSERSTDYLEYRIREFLEAIGKFINSEMTKVIFDEYKESLIREKQQPLKNLAEESSRFWDAIQDGFYDFDSNNTNVEVIKTITIDQFVDFYNNNILKTDKTARLVVHMKPCNLLPQPKELLVQCSISNYITKLGFSLSNEQLGEIVSKCSVFSDEEFTSLVEDVLTALGEESYTCISPLTFKNDLFELVKTQSLNPVPEEFPSGVLIDEVGKFKSMTQLGAAPTPMYDLKKYLLTGDAETKL